MMKLNPELFCVLLAGCFLPPIAWPASFTAPECKPLEIIEAHYSGPAVYDQGLLWKIVKQGHKPSYVFGTIHVTDRSILDLPPVVNDALENSSIFVMETLPDVDQLVALSSMLFFNDGSTLRDLLSRTMFNRTADILESYYISREAAAVIKPWAAFLAMNYPPESGAVLDEVLMNIARAGGAEIQGLETIEEQIGIFNKLAIDKQIRLLVDTVCHYDVVLDDIEMMKNLYLNRDLKGLFEYSNRYSIQDDAIYEELMENLLTRRNYIMVERMQEVLKTGNAFIAIGAMHLPGDEGVLNLLRQRNYGILPVY